MASAVPSAVQHRTAVEHISERPFTIARIIEASGYLPDGDG
jgi:hypothetical protein